MIDLNHLRISTIMKNTNDIVRDHRVHGVRIMPGVTFLDMIYRFLKTKEIDLTKVELREVLFLEPVSTSKEYDQKIEIAFEKKGEGYLVTARSQKIKGDTILSPVWEDNLRCEMYFHDRVQEKKKIDIPAIKAKAHRVEDMDYAYQYVRQIDISHREFMKPEGNLYFDDTRILAEITLSDLAAKYLDYFYMHPAYLDSATLVQGFVVLQNIDFSHQVKASIPIYIQSFRSLEAMKDKIYVYIKNEGYEDGAIKDVMYFNIEVYNEQGEEIAYFEKWGLKKIRSKKLVQNLEVIEREVKPEAKEQEQDTISKKIEKVEKNVLENQECNVQVVKEYLKKLVAPMLDKDWESIDEKEGFYNLGLDSQDLLQIVSRIEERLDTNLYPTLLFEYANIMDLSQYLWEEHRQKFYVSLKDTERDKKLEEEGNNNCMDTYSKVCFYQPQRRKHSIEKQDAIPIHNGLLFLNSSIDLSHFASSHYFSTIVAVGERYECNGKIITIPSTKPAELEKVFNKLKEDDQIPRFVVHVHKTKDESFVDKAEEAFGLLQQYIKNQGKETGRYLHIMQEEENTMQYALDGLLHCLSNERPFLYKCITVDDKNYEEAERWLESELLYDWGESTRIQYKNGTRYVKVYEKMQPGHAQESKIKANGNYLISGGAGGLGLHLAEYITERGANAILIGRSKGIAERYETIRNKEHIFYYSCDVTDVCAVEQLAEHVELEHGKLTGIFHLAGITRDGYFIQKKFQDFKEVINIKIQGLINLDEAFKQHPLDFFVSFSSIAGIMGNPSQTDYAFGNCYMDAYMSNRTGYGKSISVNWPLWKDGGMQAGAQTESAIQEKFGMDLLGLEDGLRALESILEQGYENIVVVRGNEEKLDQTFLSDRPYEEEVECMAQGKQDSKIVETKLFTSSQKSCDENDEIVIIGVSGRYPMADNLQEFWDNLKEGKDCVSEVPLERWNTEECEKVTQENWKKEVSKWGGFIKDVDKFDPMLFNIAPFQAELMDPQERIFLETAWETFEDAGYTKSELMGSSVGVYVGAMWLQYQLYNTDAEVSTSTSSSIANRVSFTFGLNGPSVAMDTMCSSTLTALHIACQAILTDDCDMALVGGVNVSIHPDKYRLLAQGNFASSNGRCNTFAEHGDGYVPSEGTGAILIKKRRDAERDGDRIYAVIKSTALNHGGNASGFTVPNPKAQEAVIERAIKKANISPETISYIEAHGTGTSLGDPIEVNALKKVYGKYTDRVQFCGIGSVKSNMGHAESAAGIAAITKVILQMQHKKLVPSIHCEQVNPNLVLESSPFYIQKTLTDWKVPEGVIFEDGKAARRRSAISAFGAGGSNAHVILEEYIPIQRNGMNSTDKEKQLILVSGQTKERLTVYVQILKDFIKERTSEYEEPVKDIEETLIEYLINSMNWNSGRINADTTLYELSFRQMEQMKFFGYIEEQYECKVTPMEFANIQTIAELAQYIKRKKAGIAGCGKKKVDEQITLSQIAYTLQVSREALKYRMAVVAETVEELIEKLETYLQENTDEMIFVGNSQGNRDYHIDYDNKMQDFYKIAETWVNGEIIEWKKFYPNGNPGLISLPHYPFAKRSFFMGRKAGKDLEQETPVKHKEPVLPKDYLGEEVALTIVEESIALITIQDREHNNAFTESVITGLMYYFHKVQQDSRIKAIVVTGDDRIFCMGGTQEQLLDISDEQLQFTDAPFLYRGMLDCKIPVISAMQGHASGGGMLFGLYADIVVMSLESIYSAVFMKYGFTPGMGATYVLEEKFGKALATEMMFTAKSYSGSELQNRGASVLFEHKEHVVDRAIEMARMIAEKPLNSLQVLKKELSERIIEPLLSCIEKENKMHKQTFTDTKVKDRIHHYYKAKEDTVQEDSKKAASEESMELDEEQILSVLMNLEDMDLEQAAQLLEELYE